MGCPAVYVLLGAILSNTGPDRKHFFVIPAEHMYATPKSWQIDVQIRTTGSANAVSNHHRRLAAKTGMAGRAQHIMGALEILRRRIGARQARRHHPGGKTAGGRRRRNPPPGRARPRRFLPWFFGDDG